MSKILPIIINPHPTLRKKAKTIALDNIKTLEFQALCRGLEQTMIEKDGVGLAAPQVDKSMRLIAVNAKDGVICMVNPEIIKLSWLKEWGNEGCLSVPDTFGQVKRYKKITCKYYDPKGKAAAISAAGLLARVIQHEIDHLDGILFIDKATRIKKIKSEE